MRTRVAIVCIALIASVSLGAQVVRLGGNIRPKPVTGPLPRTPDGKPDLSGLWIGGGTGQDMATALSKGETVPLLPETRKRMDVQLSKDDPEVNCLPITIPRGTPYPWRMVMTPTHLFFLYEMYNYRQVFMDGRKHPADPDPSWYGHGVGHWEGDTLVIDTVGYNDKGWFDFRGHPRSEKMHTIERYTRKDLGTMAIDMTFDDPGTYSKPFTLSFTARLMQGDLMEYICAENNQDVPHIQGPADTSQGGTP